MKFDHKSATLFVVAILTMSSPLSKGCAAACDAEHRIDAAAATAPFNPESWIGPPSGDVTAAMAGRGQALKQAMRDGSLDDIASEIVSMREVLGPHAGVPERRPEYGLPREPGEPDIERVIGLWTESFEHFRDKYPWQTDRTRAGHERGMGPTPRLRVSLRLARAFLQTYEAGIDGHESFRQEAVAAFDYMLAQQATNGVFGYPYLPNAKSGVAAAAARIVEKARAAGIDPVENGWIVEDPSGFGGLKFDNGMVGVGLLHAFVVTGNEAYLDGARNAGAWAVSDPLVINFNYNGFSAYLLARLYRVTGEAHFLEAARDTMWRGVISGLGENGRWVDPHNARIAYHSVMVRDLVEYYLALELAGDHDEACRIQQLILDTADNLAYQVDRFGAIEAHEMLSLEPLILASVLFGENDTWTRAININVNYLVNHFHVVMREKGVPITEALAVYIRWRVLADSESGSIDTSNAGLPRR